MANNRMWLQCNKCKRAKLIAKYYPYSGWYVPNDPKGLDDFLYTHSYHDDGTIDGKDLFKMRLESDTDFIYMQDQPVVLGRKSKLKILKEKLADLKFRLTY